MSLSALCLECGLCCDGTLFRQVSITPGERERLVQLGIGVSTKRKHDVMPLPCGKLEGRTCTIYAARPGGCQRFVCGVARQLETGQLPFDAALGHVRALQARLSALAAVWPAPEGVPVLRHARESLESPSSQMSEEAVRAFNAVEDLRYGLFMPPPG